jgi:hypothetical protein
MGRILPWMELCRAMDEWNKLRKTYATDKLGVNLLEIQ